MKRNKKAFTLIELVSVLVILAILALIVIPLVLNIIKKARIAADKRSIDAYGRSIELAIADYLLDKGEFPTSIDQLTLEYSGDTVVCSTTQLNTDSTVYLAECTVGGRNVTGYTYGAEEAVTYNSYEVGDIIEYSGSNYYVLKESTTTENTVTLLKAEPIKSSEISEYLSSTEVASKVDTSKTYAEMGYYSRDTCISGGDKSGCSSDYAVSDIKQVVDIWALHYTDDDLIIDTTGYKARLVTVDEISGLGYEWVNRSTTGGVDMIWQKTENTPIWLHLYNYTYNTMTGHDDASWYIWNVGVNAIQRGPVFEGGVTQPVIRPVITIKKSALNY